MSSTLKICGVSLEFPWRGTLHNLHGNLLGNLFQCRQLLNPTRDTYMCVKAKCHVTRGHTRTNTYRSSAKCVIKEDQKIWGVIKPSRSTWDWFICPIAHVWEHVGSVNLTRAQDDPDFKFVIYSCNKTSALRLKITSNSIIFNLTDKDFFTTAWNWFLWSGSFKKWKMGAILISAHFNSTELYRQASMPLYTTLAGSTFQIQLRWVEGWVSLGNIINVPKKL